MHNSRRRGTVCGPPATRQLLAAALLMATIGCGDAASAQIKPAEEQITEALRAAPASLREGAGVIGYGDAGELVTLRKATNSLLCLADAPGDGQFEVACYHAELEPFMARGRELRAAGVTGGERQRTRWSEIEAGTLPMPRHPAALYVLSATSPEDEGRTRTVIYVPYATAEELALPAAPQGGQPWLMMPGTPSAHIMIDR